MISLIIRKHPPTQAEAVMEKQFRAQLVTYLHLCPVDLRHSGRKHLSAGWWPVTQVHVVALDSIDLHRAADEGQWIGADINPCLSGQVVENGWLWHDPAARRIRAHLVDLNAEPFGCFRRERHLLDLGVQRGLV